MDPATLILIAIKTSILLIVFGLGLVASLQDALYLFRNPKQLGRALLAMNVFHPAVAILIVSIFPLDPAVKIALIALSVSPIPPFLPKKHYKAGGRTPFIIGLLVAISLASIVFTPIAIELLGMVFEKETHVSPLIVAKVVFLSVLLPLGVGMAVRGLFPSLALKIAEPLSGLGTLLLAAAFLPVLTTAGSAMLSLVGDGTVLAIMSFVLLGLIVGHLLGGPNPADRGTLALATASRHPAMALAIAGANFPGQRKIVLIAILLYLIVAGIVSIPYRIWERKCLAQRR